jgi:glyoxylase-like metal-dependent hydrolase (beta-lactamase superfamily II)
MKATAVTANLTQLTRFGLVNAYLVREDDGFTLIDTMVKGSGRALADAAGGTPIRRIVITHAHSDHVGSLRELALILPDAELIASSREARLMRGDRGLDPGEPEAKLRGIEELGLEFGRQVEEGERIGSLEVVAAPGHTPGQIALLDDRDRSLIAADAYSTVGSVATSAGPYWRFPLPGIVTWHRPTAALTAAKLRDLDPAVLVAGHGPAVTAPGEAMSAALERHA